MGISLAPEPTEQDDDPLKPKKAPVAPVPQAAPIALAPQAPGKAGGVPPMTAPAMTPPGGIPAPTVAAPSAPVDRVRLATETYNNMAPTRQAQYEAASRDNIRTSAGLGQIASGGLRTREGDLRLARDRDLDTLRKDLSLKAAEGSIADATTAFQQGLAGSQQGLSEKIGLAGIENQKGTLDLNREGLALEKEKASTSANQSQQQIDLAKKAQADQVALQTAAAALDEKVRNGQLTLAQRNQALAELTQQQNQGNEQQRIQLAKDQMAEEGKRFGLSLAQQKELATIADKTQNRSIDVSTAQGKNALLLELARIMGAKDLSSIDPNFLASIAKALGITIPGTTTTTTGTTSTTGTKPRDDWSTTITDEERYG